MFSLRPSLSFLFLFITSISFAQSTSIAPEQTFTQPGTFELGGSISFSSQKYESSSSSTSIFSINPYVGYFVVKGFELGISPGISFQRTSYMHATTFNVFFAPAYNFTLSGGLFPYVEALIGYTSYHEKDDGQFEDYTEIREGYAIGGVAGFKAAVRQNALVIFSIQYLQEKYKRNTPYYFDYSDRAFTVVSAGIGFRIYIDSGHTKK